MSSYLARIVARAAGSDGTLPAFRPARHAWSAPPGELPGQASPDVVFPQDAVTPVTPSPAAAVRVGKPAIAGGLVRSEGRAVPAGEPTAARRARRDSPWTEKTVVAVGRAETAPVEPVRPEPAQEPASPRLRQKGLPEADEHAVRLQPGPSAPVNAPTQPVSSPASPGARETVIPESEIEPQSPRSEYPNGKVERGNAEVRPIVISTFPFGRVVGSMPNRSQPTPAELQPRPPDVPPVAPAVSATAGPKLTIGKLTVEVVPPAPAPKQTVVVHERSRESGSRAAPQSQGSSSKLRFGIGQM